ncbi:hypothetical protein [Paenibacillus amylolyticus]|uniref:hypothetical protein n=1 Tax=Paenibacillus amylolyticus TaxID=1451 RepID=UPI00249B658B|nr:hypothetical protein [Paenibacillus amylolyticus]WFA82710.1 hypothetical protein OGI70_16755 [Paenibacillus amylolyticus]
MKKSSSSINQSSAEKTLLNKYKKLIGNTRIKPQRLILDEENNVYIDLDGYEEGQYAIEIYAHIGSLKAGQRKKIATDILKLSLIDVPNKILIVHNDVKNWLDKNSWIASAVKKHNIKVESADYSKTMEEKIRRTQKKQNRTT